MQQFFSKLFHFNYFYVNWHFQNLRDKKMYEIITFTRKELENLLLSHNLEKFRAKQIFQWIYQKGIFDFLSMTNISKQHRKFLSDYFKISLPSIIQIKESTDGTKKFALKLQDGEIIESVLIPDNNRLTLCISTQVGCKMGCKFCYTARLGFKRNLETFEIIAQILTAKFKILKPEERLTNLVFMGMGEPLDNLTNLQKSLNIIYDEFGLNYSYRKVTVSTVGIIDKMIELGKTVDVNLAISLHCADNEKRNKLIPINKKYPLDKLIEACKNFPVRNRQRITFEYILIENFNDSLYDAKNLVKILSKVKSKVNLIRFNPFPGANINPPKMDKILEFQNFLIKKGYTATLRKSKGDDILAACGQLSGKLSI